MNTLTQNSDSLARSLGLLDPIPWQPVRIASFKKSKHRKAPQKRHPICKWLRDRTSRIDIGKKWDSHPIHLNKNEKIILCLSNAETRLLDRMTNRKYEDHFAERETYYFAGNEDKKAPLTLVMIDIDNHHRGSYEAAVAFAEFLRAEHFPDLYFEPSTNKNGIHGYFVLDKQGWSVVELNDLLLNRLQPFLRMLAKEFDVEGVEIKGTMPVITWDHRNVSRFKAGNLAKLPRESHRFEELKRTTVVDPIWLINLPEVAPEPAAKISRQKSGSIAGKFISEDEIAELDGHYAQIARKLIANHTIEVNCSRAVVREVDVAIFLMLGKYFTEHMQDDGSMPWACWKGLWTSLKDCGDIDRAFCMHRFKAIRDYFSSLGLIDWEDNTYYPGFGNEKGKACKWRFSEQLMEMLDAPTLQEEGEASIAVTEFVDSLIQVPVEMAIMPVRVFKFINEREKLWRMEQQVEELFALAG